MRTEATYTKDRRKNSPKGLIFINALKASATSTVLGDILIHGKVERVVLSTAESP